MKIAANQVTVWLSPEASADEDIVNCPDCGCVWGIDHTYDTVVQGKIVEVKVACPAPHTQIPEKRLGITNRDWCAKLAATISGYMKETPKSGNIAVFSRV
jgi:hypothetical protein